MWFRRKKKPNEDRVLNETLRSLQGILEERDTTETDETDTRREPSLHAGDPPRQQSTAAGATHHSTTPTEQAEQSAETTWHNLSLSFDVEPRARPEPEPSAGEDAVPAAGDESRAVSDEENEGLEIQEARAGADSISGAVPSDDDDIEISIDSPAPGFALDGERSEPDSAIKFGSSTVEITLDIGASDGEGDEAGARDADGTDDQPVEEDVPTTGSADRAGQGEIAAGAAESSQPRTRDAATEGDDSASPIAADQTGDQAAAAAQDLTPPVEEPGGEPIAATDAVEPAAAAPADQTGDQTAAAVQVLTPPVDESGGEPIAATDTVESATAAPADQTGDQTAAAAQVLTPPVDESGGEPIAATDTVESVTAAPADDTRHHTEAAARDSTRAIAEAANGVGAVAAPEVDEATVAVPTAEHNEPERGIDGDPTQEVDVHYASLSPRVADSGVSQERKGETADAIAAVAEAIRDAELLRRQAGDAGTGAAPESEVPATAPQPEESAQPTASAGGPVSKYHEGGAADAAADDEVGEPSSAGNGPKADDIDAGIPLLDDLVYVPRAETDTGGQAIAEPPPPDRRASSPPQPAERPPSQLQDPALRPLVQRITQNLRLRLELGEGTPLDEEQESQLRDALFDTLAQWKERGDLH